MRSRIVLGCLTLIFIAFLGLGILAILNWREAARRDHPLEENRLTALEKAEVIEAKRLWEEFGDEIWPGYSTNGFVVILFNDRYEFLLGVPQPPSEWTQVEDEPVLGGHYFRRTSDDPQAFAVAVGENWAGSAFTLRYMNRDYLLGARRQLPAVLAPLFPYWFVTFGQDFHIMLLLHEHFHAFQAREAPTRFDIARRSYAVERDYPFGDEAFRRLWDQEGAALQRAREAEDRVTACAAVRDFLRLRAERRSNAELGSLLVEFEKQLEWLEGLAKFAEMRFYELAASPSATSSAVTYRRRPHYWRDEQRRLESSLGAQSGDFRFYLSGSAQALLLDRLAPDWKSETQLGDLDLEAALGRTCAD